MKVLVADDEPLARERLTALLSEIDGVEEVAEAGDGRSALHRVVEERPDVVLLDIRMPGMDGMEVARHVAAMERPPAVVFTTAYDQHALAAFEARAVDYLLKPIQRDRLAMALGRARALGRAQVEAVDTRPDRRRTHISVPSRQGLTVVAVDEVRYLMADRKYVTVGFPGGELLTEESLRGFEDELGDRFIRVHRNALAAAKYITGLERDGEGRYRVVLEGVTRRLDVSRRLLPEVRRRLRQGQA